MLCVAVMTVTVPINAPVPLKLRIEDFELLDRGGAFEGYAKVELIDGVILAMNAEYSPHTLIKSELLFRLRLALRDLDTDYTAVVEPTLALPPYSLPEPDVMVTRAPGGREYFKAEHVAIVIEVADSSAANDLGPKRQLYAGKGLREYWVLDLPGGRVHQFWSPDGDDYREMRTVMLGSELRSFTWPELAIDGSGLI
jgi:Uma2 family endonuclease